MAGAAPTARPAPFLKPLDLLDRGILLAESSLSVVVVIVMVLAAVLDTLSGALQAFAGIQLKFAQGAGDVLMNGTIWAAFLGASFATRGRRHLAIDAIGRLLPDRARRVTVAIAATLGAVVAFALARGVYEALAEQAHTVAEQLRANQENGIADARVDRSYEYHYVIPFGFVLIALRLLMHGFHEFLAAYRGGAAHSPIEPASDKSRVHHAEPEDATRPADEGVPAEAAVPAELEKHVAPVSQASGAEIVIAIGALIAVVAASAGSTIFAPVSVIVTLAVLTLGVPLVLRWRNRANAKTSWLDAPVPSDEKPLSDPKPVELGVAQVGVGGHVAVAKGPRVADVGAELRLGAVLHHALRHVEVGADAPALAVHRVAAHALSREDREAGPRRRAPGLARGHGVRKDVLEARDLDGRELPRARVRGEVHLRGAGPDEVRGPRVRPLRADGRPRGRVEVPHREVRAALQQPSALQGNGVPVPRAQHERPPAVALRGSKALAQHGLQRQRREALHALVVRVPPGDRARWGGAREVAQRERAHHPPVDLEGDGRLGCRGSFDAPRARRDDQREQRAPHPRSPFGAVRHTHATKRA